jgi:hypothetical protein
MAAADKLIRNRKNKVVSDPANIADLTFNEMSGAKKNLPVGPFLIPIDDGAGGKTTSATTIRALELGSQLYIYNTTGAAASVRFSNNPAATALAAGVVDAPSGDVGVPCSPGIYTQLCNFDHRYIITQAGLLIFKVNDGTRIVDQNPGFTGILNAP